MFNDFIHYQPGFLLLQPNAPSHTHTAKGDQSGEQSGKKGEDVDKRCLKKKKKSICSVSHFTNIYCGTTPCQALGPPLRVSGINQIQPLGAHKWSHLQLIFMD